MLAPPSRSGDDQATTDLGDSVSEACYHRLADESQLETDPSPADSRSPSAGIESWWQRQYCQHPTLFWRAIVSAMSENKHRARLLARRAAVFLVYIILGTAAVLAAIVYFGLIYPAKRSASGPTYA